MRGPMTSTPDRPEQDEIVDDHDPAVGDQVTVQPGSATSERAAQAREQGYRNAADQPGGDGSEPTDETP